jgi:hypothetical protein
VGPRGLVVGTTVARDSRQLSFFHVRAYDDRPVDAVGVLILSEVVRDNIAVAGQVTEAMVFGTGEAAPEGRALHVYGPLGGGRSP